MDNTIAIARAIRELDCSEDIKKALQELFSLELETSVPITKSRYFTLIEKYADSTALKDEDN